MRAKRSSGLACAQAPPATLPVSQPLGVGELTSLLCTAVRATPPPLTACLLSAQCQRLPPAQLLVPAGQPAAPGPALRSHQGDGDSPGPPQSLAGEWLWRMGTGWGAEGRGVPSAGHEPAGGPRARVGASSRWGREGSTGALRETPPASPPPEGCRFSRPRRDRGSGPPEVGLSLP